MALGCRYILALSHRAHLLHLDGDPWQNDMRAAVERRGRVLLFLLGHGAAMASCSGMGVSLWPGHNRAENKGNGVWPPPVISAKRSKATEHSRASAGTCVCAHRSYTVRGKKSIMRLKYTETNCQ